MASIYDNWMRTLNEEDDDLAGPEEQAALLSYLNGTTTAKEAAPQFTEPENRSAVHTWSLLIDAVEEFPQAHQRLVELLDVIAKLPTSAKGIAPESGGNLQGFLFELHEAFNGIQSASQSSHSTITDEDHYINLCAFIARIWHQQHGEWAEWAMLLSHDGLEDDHGKSLANLFGQAVAQLFLFSGPEMYASSNAIEFSGYCAGPLLLKERKTATVSRWDFWRRRLGQLKESELLSNKTRESFSKVLENMAKVEAENEG